MAGRDELPRDDGYLERFDRRGARRQSARGALVAIGACALVLLLFAGDSIKAAGEREPGGLGRTVLIAIGTPAEWLADALPFDEAATVVTDLVSPDDSDEASEPGFSDQAADAGGPVAPITTDHFDPVDLGELPADPPALEKLLVTGDSLSTPMDAEIARELAADGVEVIQDPHLATGVSNTALVDWGSLARRQVREHEPDAVVVLIGANEGYPFTLAGAEVECCDPEWATIYAQRAREMINTFRQDGEARVYWLTVPTPRDSDRQPVAHAVNAAVSVAAAPWRSHVQVLDLVEVFSPGERYRDAMEVDGSEQIVRDSDGIHLSDRGSEIAADLVIDRLAIDHEIGE